MTVNLDSEVLKTGDKFVSGGLLGVLGKNYTANVDADIIKRVDKSEGIKIIGYSKIAANLILNHGNSRHDYNNLCIILEVKQHFYFTIGLESGKYSRCVIIIEKLAAEFEIELSAKARDSFKYLLRLQLYIFVVIKSNF